MSKGAVLDASAVLALLNDEPGADAVEQALIDGAVISAVNLAEVVRKLVDVGLTQREVRQALGSIGLTVRDLDLPQVYAAEQLRSRKRSASAGLSLGGRACMALAVSLDLPVLTADRAWLELDLPVEVRVIR